MRRSLKWRKGIDVMSQQTTEQAQPMLPDLVRYSLLNVHQVAGLLGVSVSTVWKWNKIGRLPKRILLGPKTARWKAGEILDAIDAEIPEVEEGK